MKHIVVVMGNIGTGKSTFVSTLNRRNHRCFIENDDYEEGQESKFNKDIESAVLSGKNIILEGNYMTRCLRSTIVNNSDFKLHGYRFVCFDFGPGNDASLKRRLAEPVIPEQETIDVHEQYKREYEKPTVYEGFSKVIYCFDEKEM